MTGAFGILNAQTPAASGASTQRRGEPVTLNFNNAEIEAIARTMGVITGRNVVVDPRVKGTMSLTTESPVPPARALGLFEAQLRMQGFAVVESAGLYKVVPEADAKLQSGTVSAGAATTSGGQILTQIFRLNHETANNLVPVLRPLISPNNTINVNPGNNSLVVTDYADNLQRIGRIIAALDVSNATDLEIIPLRHAIATDLAPLVLRLMESGSGPVAAQGQADTSFRTTVLAEPRGNTLIARTANAARMALLKTLVNQLDQPAASQPNGNAGNIYVVYLKNADAVKLAAMLRASLAGEVRGGASSGGVSAAAPRGAVTNPGTAATAPSAEPSTGGQIQADPATNSLIITAPEPQYRQIRAVIDKLDSRRAQVFVESLIAEVNADTTSEFGIQLQTAIGQAGNNLVGFIGTNFGTGGNNILTLATEGATGTVRPGTGANFGGARLTNGKYILGLLGRLLETNGDGNILSTPNLLTLDNEEAKIVIGQNVPFVTGSFTNTGSNNGSVNPFQTVERKDVGLTLRVKPQISENGTIKMQIFQEVSSVQASSVNSPTGLITNKRSIESNVLVEDGGIVVLGGLMQDEYSGNQEKVPFLGDVPILGNLFKTETRGRKRTNLMVFLRPVVIRDATASDSLSMDRYDLMRNAQKEAQPAPRTMLNINDAPVLPPLRPPTEPKSTPLGPSGIVRPSPLGP